MNVPMSTTSSFNSNNQHIPTPPEFASEAPTIAALEQQRTFYGYEDHMPDKARLVLSGNVSDAGHVNFLEDCPPMPPDRLARKQRDRRGGACHSVLLKSAVLASMASNHEGDDNANGDNALVLMQQSLLTSADASGHSPRKRVRRAPARGRSRNSSYQADSPASAAQQEQHELSVAQASLMLDSFTFSKDEESEEEENGGDADDGDKDRVPSMPPRRCPPVRRVSRRTSYEDRVKAHNTDDDDSVTGETDEEED